MSGCDNTKEDANDGKETSNNAKQITNDNEEKANEINISNELMKEQTDKKKLTMILYGEKPEEFNKIAELIEEKSCIDVKLDFKWYGRLEYDMQLRTALETNNIDIYCPRWSDEVFFKHVDSYKDITDLLPKYAPNIYNKLVENDEVNALKYDGRIYLLPRMLHTKRCIYVDFIDEYIQKYNLGPVETINDYVQALDKIYTGEERSPGQEIYMFDITHLIAYAYDYIILDYNYHLLYKLDDDKMKVIPVEDIPEFKETVLLFNDMYKKKLLKSQFHDYEERISKIFINYSEALEEGRTRFQLYPDKKLQREPATYTKVIHRSSDVAPEAIKLFEWIHSNQEAYDLVNYGIEDIHYELKDEKINILKKFSIMSLFKNNQFDRTGLFMQESNDSDDVSLYPPHQGFCPKIPTYRRKDIFNHEIKYKIWRGQCDQTQLKYAIEKLKTEGTVEKVVNKYQQQLNKWIELNK